MTTRAQVELNEFNKLRREFEKALDTFAELCEDRTRETERGERHCTNGVWDTPTTRKEIDAARNTVLRLAGVVEQE